MNFNNVYKNKKVFITGNTGFKGSWLSLWLTMLGAKVYGYSLYKTDPCHFDLLKLNINSVKGNINHKKNISKSIQEVNPDIVFHLAAMPLVRQSYKLPHLTYLTNVMGTLNVFEAAVKCKNLKAIINITTDKVYENKETSYAYKETDPLGGYDMYSSSKACSEILTSSFRRAFFNPDQYNISHHILIASARAGNVIGGGDWAEDRLIPDVIRAATENKKLIIRSPFSIRPWQHVLDALCGYLMLGEKLLQEEKLFADSWNFGPVVDDGPFIVKDVLLMSQKIWKEIHWEEMKDTSYHEAQNLSLDCSKSMKNLKWKPKYRTEKSIEKTISWYKDFYQSNKINSIDEIEMYNN